MDPVCLLTSLMLSSGALIPINKINGGKKKQIWISNVGSEINK